MDFDDSFEADTPWVTCPKVMLGGKKPSSSTAIPTALSLAAMLSTTLPGLLCRAKSVEQTLKKDREAVKKAFHELERKSAKAVECQVSRASS
nr:hypothetical protein Itr_chr06CG18900 [Ipomoea trifida]